MLFNKRSKEIPDCACFSIKDPKESILRMLFDQSTKEIHPVYVRHLAMPDGLGEIAVCVCCLSLVLVFSAAPVWPSPFSRRLGMKSLIAWGATKDR